MRTSLIATLGLALISLPLLRADDEVKPRATLRGHTGRVNALAFSPNGKHLASAGQDKTVRIWDAATGELRHTLAGHDDEVLSVAFRPDGGLLASGGAKAKPSIKAELSIGPKVAAKSEEKPDRAASKAGEVIIWDLDDGEVFRRHDFPSPVARVAYGPKNVFAAACRDGSVNQRYTCTGKVVVSRPMTEAGLRFVAFRADGLVVASDGGHRPSLWNATSGERIASFESHSFGASSVALSPDGKTLATVGVNELKLWDAATGKLRFSPQGIYGHTQALAFTPDGKTLVTGGNNCNARAENGQQSVELNLWDVATGERRAYFPGELPFVRSLAVSPDGKTLATGGGKDNISLWDLASARPVSKAAEKAGAEKKGE